MLKLADLKSYFINFVKPGDTILVHSAFKSLGPIEGGAETLITMFLELLGPKGTLLLPTFNFQSWTEQHYFDVKETPSKMGIVSEVALQRSDCKRSSHPIYSFAVIGAHTNDFLNSNDTEAYGPNSVFSLFHKLNGTIVSIGLDFNNTFSFHHYVEYRVGCEYRRVKEFSGIYIGHDRVPLLKTYTMCVRREQRIKTYIVPAMTELLESGIINQILIGETKIHYANASLFFDNMSKIVENHPEKLHYVEGTQK